ncbi:MAG: transcriptional regulator [Proteobacteria bacterium]|nr:MAG: transcriptional regulator [Pseudomonadota bacterium]
MNKKQCPSSITLCPVSTTLDIFNDKWKLFIIWHLIDKKKRFKELNEDLCDITQKTLTIKLRELEERKIINRKVYAQIPPKVEYSLTPIGQKLKPVLEEMYKWGMEYMKN